MNATGHFIADRAQTLAYEAIQFPATAETALAWLHRAVACAEGKGLTVLAGELRTLERRAAGQDEPTDGQTIDALPMWAGEGEV